MEENEQIIINIEEAGQRLDRILSTRFTGIRSRTYFQMLIEEEKVLVNGLPVKKRMLPKEGDEVQIQFILTPEIGLEAENISLNILFEDEDLLIINKPPGMVVHPAVGNWTGTFVNALLYHCQTLDTTGSLRPGIVHRLDKETSGLLVAAKNTFTQQKLIELFASRKIYKEYLAVCLGNPGNRRIETLIGRDKNNRQKMAVVEEGGREAVTICHVLGHDDKFSFLRIELETGRTHQIRVHLKYCHCPILGDSTYGNLDANKKYKVTRQLLHASLLRFIHPITGKLLEIKAPLPEDMQLWHQRLCPISPEKI